MLKKVIAALVMITVLFSAAALAEDLSVLKDEELLELHRNVQDELERRGLSVGQETDFETAAVRERMRDFFSYWSSNDLDNMLSMCDSGWKATVEDPRTELFRILMNRTPMDLVIESASPIAGEGPGDFPYYLVTVISDIDRNNGKSTARYLFHMLMRKEDDGLWHVDPTGLGNYEKAEEDLPAEATAAPEEDAEAGSADPVLYYCPAGGEYYHLDQNCRRVNPTLLPLQDCFRYSELNGEPYRDLKPCEICGAPPAPEAESTSETGAADPFRFETFRDAVNALNGAEMYVTGSDYCAALIERDGRCFRAVALYDEHAKELYAAYNIIPVPEDGALPSNEWRALDEYTMTLPVQYTEELSVVPFTQEELDAMAGKTIGEVMSEPWELQMNNYPEDAEAGKEIVFPMTKGFCKYELVINEPFEIYEERRAADRYDPVTVMSLRNYEDLTVKCVRYAGLSYHTLDLRYRADGTPESETDPFIGSDEYDLMLKIVDVLEAAWGNRDPGQEAREAMIAKLTEEYPEAAEMIRQIVESLH